MLIVHSINPTGAFSYGECSSFDLEQQGLVNLKGVNADSGGSNGSGKTSLFNTLCVLLFDRNPTGAKDNDIPNAVWRHGMACRCEFTSWEGIRYRVTSCRDWKRGDFYPADNDNGASYVGTSLYLDKLEGGVWVDSRSNSMKATREKILEAVGMSYDQFLSIAYMSHRVGSTFLRGTNKDRVDTLTGITGVGEWDKVLDKARNKRKILKSEIDSIEREISYLQGSKKELEIQAESISSQDWKSKRKCLENDLETLREQYKAESEELKKAKKEVSELMIRRDSSYSKEIIEGLNSKIKEDTSKIKDIEKEISRVMYSDYLHNELFVNYKESESRVRSIEMGLKHMNGETTFLSMKNCPTCGSKIDKAKKDSISAKIAEMESALNVAREDFRASKESWDYFKNNETQRFHNEIELLRSSISKSQEEIQKELNTYHSIDSSVSEKNVIIESHNNKMNYIKSMGDVKNREINNIEESLKKLESIKLRIAKSSVEIDEKSSSIYSITGDIGICDWFINNVPYIKLHKLSTSMEELTNVVNGYLSDMGDTIRVNISSFDEKAKKKNAADVKDLLKSEVKVEINDGDKKIDPRLYSDGEISKVSNAFIRGLNELARKFGYGCNLMLLDEVFSFIDMDNSHKLVDSFKKDFRKRGTVLITDNSGISENLLTFDGTWIARKSNGKTVLSIHKGLSETKE